MQVFDSILTFLSVVAICSTTSTIFCNAYCPVVICPGFGNDIVDYDTPLQQPSEVGFKSVLSRRGFDPEMIYTVPVQRSDWIRVAGGLLDIPDFYTGNAKPTGFGYGWYLDRLRETVNRAYQESGGQRVLLVGHSAGGWLARAAMGNGKEWITADDDETSDFGVVPTSDRIQGLVSLGAIHKVPEQESTCVTRGALKYTDAMYPGAYLKKEGIAYVSVGGAAILGNDSKDDTNEKGEPTTTTATTAEADALYSKRGEGNAERVAYTSYQSVCGTGSVIGDGVVPLEWTQLEGSRQIQLDGVLHSINEAGTTIPTDRWYGSEAVIDRWLPAVLEETGLKSSKTFSFAGFPLPNFFDTSVTNR